MRYEISVDDGSKEDWKIFELLKKHGLTDIATFYIAPYNPQHEMLSRRQIADIAKECQIGGHTLTHPVLTKETKDNQIKEILEGNATLKEITGKEIEKFAPPRGWYNEEVIESVKQCGMKTMRTMKQGVFSLPDDPFILPITIHAHPYHLGAWRDILELAKANEHGYYHITMHGWEIERFKLWEKINEIFYAIADARN